MSCRFPHVDCPEERCGDKLYKNLVEWALVSPRSRSWKDCEACNTAAISGGCGTDVEFLNCNDLDKYQWESCLLGGISNISSWIPRNILFFDKLHVINPSLPHAVGALTPRLEGYLYTKIISKLTTNKLIQSTPAQNNGHSLRVWELSRSLRMSLWDIMRGVQIF